MSAQTQSTLPEAKHLALVPDILFDIFLSITAREDLVWIEPANSTIRHRYHDSTRDLRELTQVCQYWRNVALSSPKLWSQHVDCTNQAPKWFQEIVRRSQDVPLLVSVGRPYTPRPFPNHTLANLEFLFETQKHFAEFHVDLVLQTLAIKNALLDRLRAPMPFLSKCTFYYFPEEEEILRLRTPSEFNLFGGSIPAWLRKLHFRGCLPHTQPEVLRPLTHLCLLDCHPPDAGWHSLLQNTPSLEKLTLTVSARTNSDIDPAPSTVDLPYLTSLSVEGDYVGVGGLLAAINPSQLMSLSCHLNNIAIQSARSLLDPLKRLFPPTNDMQSNNETTIFMRIDDLHIKVITEGGFVLSLDLRQYGIYHQTSYLSLLMDTCRPLFSSCRHLTLDGLKGDVDRLLNDSLFILLLPFINARKVTFTKAIHARLLKRRTHTTRLFPQHPVLFPELDTLVLSCSIYKFFDDAESFLDSKRKEGHPVRKVLFPVDSMWPVEALDKQRILCEKYDVDIEFYDQ